LTPSVRAFYRAQQDNTCEMCGTHADEADELQLHHRVRQADGGTNHPDNLLLLCKRCHGRHHWTLDSEQAVSVAKRRAEARTTAGDGPADADADDGSVDEDDAIAAGDDSADSTPTPLPPRSDPNGTDGKILSVIEAQGPVPTGVIAEQVDISEQYVRRQCWKLSGEQLIARIDAGTWELRDRASDDDLIIGLPETPKRAKRAGRDEVIRQLSAYGMAHTKIAETTGLSRSTIDIAVDRARALRIDGDDDGPVDLQTIAMRVSALLDMIEHAQTQHTSSQSRTE
jgi:DNA-binding Lrp family transcriptional regulator